MFFNRLDKLCKANNMTVAALARRIGISSGTASRWKKGYYPTAEILIKLARELNCSIDYLLGLTDNNNTVTNSGKSFTITNQDLKKLKDFIKYFDNNSNDG